jgi:hypothetical protein
LTSEDFSTVISPGSIPKSLPVGHGKSACICWLKDLLLSVSCEQSISYNIVNLWRFRKALKGGHSSTYAVRVTVTAVKRVRFFAVSGSSDAVCTGRLVSDSNMVENVRKGKRRHWPLGEERSRDVWSRHHLVRDARFTQNPLVRAASRPRGFSSN